MESKARSTDKVSGAIERFSGFGEGAAGGGTFIFEAYDKDGNLKWRDEAKNLTTNVGRQDMNAKYFDGSSYDAFWYIGLVNNSPTPVYSVTDTCQTLTLAVYGQKPLLMTVQTVLRLTLVEQLTTILRSLLTQSPRAVRSQALALPAR